MQPAWSAGLLVLEHSQVTLSWVVPSLLAHILQCQFRERFAGLFNWNQSLKKIRQALLFFGFNGYYSTELNRKALDLEKCLLKSMRERALTPAVNTSSWPFPQKIQTLALQCLVMFLRSIWQTKGCVFPISSVIIRRQIRLLKKNSLIFARILPCAANKCILKEICLTRKITKEFLKSYI